MTPIRLMTLDPGHFHAALVQKEMYSQVDKKVHVYAPLKNDLTDHLNRIAGFNTRAEKPTKWELEVHTGPDYLQRLLLEKPGNVVVLSGRNRAKIDYLLAAVQAGLNVLADKPWVLVPEDLEKLQTALDTADKKGLIAYDIMTERYEITSLLQREMVQAKEVFGEPIKGTPDEPGVYMESVHYLKKLVAGMPLKRPEWYFDITQQGEGLSDVGTHLVDLVPWMLFPGEVIERERDIEMVSGKRKPTLISKSDYQAVTGAADFADTLAKWINEDRLAFYCNNYVTYKIRGIHVKLDVLWDFEAAPGAGDNHLAVVRGTKARVEIRQGKEQNFIPELYVISNDAPIDDPLKAKIEQLQANYPGVGLEKTDDDWQITIPDKYRVGHEAHFAQVTEQFLKYLDNPKSLPAWEKPNMLAKYFVTTNGVAMCQ